MALPPTDAGQWYAQGVARLDEGRLDEAEECFRQALLLAPGNAKANVNLGLILQHKGRRAEARQRYEAAVQADPQLAQAWFNLGTVAMESGRTDDAIANFRKASSLDATRPDWQAALDAALQSAASSLLWTASVSPEGDREQIFQQHLSWARGRAKIAVPAHGNSRNPGRRIRIGYLAPDFRERTIAAVLEPVLARHDPAQVGVFCYSDGASANPAGWRLRARRIAWRATAGMDHDELARRIREDGIDILVELAGHAWGGARIPLLERKPAPIQATFLGSPGTTALDAVDYRLAGPDEKSHERYFTERIVRLASQHCEAEALTRELESAYRIMWRRWCEGKPAEGFKVKGEIRPITKESAAAPAKNRNSRQVLVDGVFFQDYNTGIARVWRSLLREWSANGFAERVLVLDREGSLPDFPGIRRRRIARHDYARLSEDRAMLQQVCDEEGAAVFISTYYSSPLRTPSVMLAYDMIPEVFDNDLTRPEWAEKETCIGHASRFVAISRSTADDLCSFYPEVPPAKVAVANCGVDPLFRPATAPEVEEFRRRHGIGKRYFLHVGSRVTYKDAATLFRAFSRLPGRSSFGMVCVGGEASLDAEHRACCEGSELHHLRLEDADLRLAYAGAVALVYPSVYEGFGMPVAEAMASGCPVITTNCASLPEVGGDSALYVEPLDVEGFVRAMEQVQEPALRATMAASGVKHARMFSWITMAQSVSAALTEACNE